MKEVKHTPGPWYSQGAAITAQDKEICVMTLKLIHGKDLGREDWPEVQRAQQSLKNSTL